MNDDPGVLGRLPRSRPGTRSGKRPAAGSARAARAAEPRGTKASRPAAGTAKARATAKPRAEGRPRRPARGQGGDPITGVLRTTAKAAEGGVKLAGGLARELLRRLPRP